MFKVGQQVAIAPHVTRGDLHAVSISGSVDNILDGATGVIAKIKGDKVYVSWSFGAELFVIDNMLRLTGKEQAKIAAAISADHSDYYAAITGE